MLKKYGYNGCFNNLIVKMKKLIIPCILIIPNVLAVSNPDLGKMVQGSPVYEAVTQDYLAYFQNAPIGPGQTGPGYHPGIDYRASVGSTVYAPIDGTVTRVDLANATTGALNGFGTVTIKDLNSEKRFIFLHLNTSYVRVGDSIIQGCLIGLSGQTGTGSPHLHVEVRDGINRNGGAFYFDSETNTGVNEDPADYITSYTPVYSSYPCN